MKKDPRVEKFIDLWKKHYKDCLSKCPDCGGFSIHVCETALRKMLASQINRMDKEIFLSKS